MFVFPVLSVSVEGRLDEAGWGEGGLVAIAAAPYTSSFYCLLALFQRDVVMHTLKNVRE